MPVRLREKPTLYGAVARGRKRAAMPTIPACACGLSRLASGWTGKDRDLNRRDWGKPQRKCAAFSLSLQGLLFKGFAMPDIWEGRRLRRLSFGLPVYDKASVKPRPRSLADSAQDCAQKHLV